MAKRVVVVAVALLILTGQGTAGAGTSPRWPCRVTVSIDAGPLHRVGVNALRQLDAASEISWVLVSEGGMVEVHWQHPADPAAAEMATTWASDKEVVAGSLEIDPAVPAAWRLYTTLHGFGHLGGIDHNSDPSSVMGGGSTPWKHYGAGDLDLLSKVRCR